MAKVYKRPGSKNWWIRYQVDGAESRESSGTSNKVEAEKILGQRLNKARELSEAGPRLSFKLAVVRFFDTVSLKPTTMRCYKICFRNWFPHIGELFLDEIERTTLQRFVRSRKEEGVTDATIRRDLAFLSTLFTYMMAQYEDAPQINPVIGFSKKKLKEKKRLRFLTQAEYQVLLGACSAPEYRNIVILAVETGMRLGELMNLTWDRVSLNRREVYLDYTKSGLPRVVPLTDEAVRVFFGTVRHSRSNHVFWYGEGRPYTTFKNWWEGTVRRSGIQDLRYHDLRHTFASWYLQRGGKLDRLKEIMGHSSIAVTEKYGHLRTEDLHADIRSLPAQSSAQKLLI